MIASVQTAEPHRKKVRFQELLGQPSPVVSKVLPAGAGAGGVVWTSHKLLCCVSVLLFL